MVSAWATLPMGPDGYVVAGPQQQYWIIAAGAGPYGSPATYTWNPLPITVTTKAGKVTTIPQKPVQMTGIPWAPRPAKCVTDKKGTTTCTPQPPVMVAAKTLTMATEANDGTPCTASQAAQGCTANALMQFQTPWVMSPPTAPLWPGQTAWASQDTGDTFGGAITLMWPGGHKAGFPLNVNPPAP